MSGHTTPFFDGNYKRIQPTTLSMKQIRNEADEMASHLRELLNVDHTKLSFNLQLVQGKQDPTNGRDYFLIFCGDMKTVYQQMTGQTIGEETSHDDIIDEFYSTLGNMVFDLEWSGGKCKKCESPFSVDRATRICTDCELLHPELLKQ